MNRVRAFSLHRYIETALLYAEYERDEDGVIIALVPAASGFFAQGDSFEEARSNLRDVIEGNIMLALQLGFAIPTIKGIEIEEQDAEALPLKAEQVIRKLRKLGYEGPVAGGRHSRMVHRQHGKIIPLPIHGGKDISVGLIRSILREVGVTPMVTLTIQEQTARQLAQIARHHATSVDELAEQAIRSHLRLEAKQILAREAEAFSAMHKELVQQHVGHYVAIQSGVLIDFDKSQLDLILRVEDRFPDEVILIRQVNLEPEKVYHIRSPRIVHERLT